MHLDSKSAGLCGHPDHEKPGYKFPPGPRTGKDGRGQLTGQQDPLKFLLSLVREYGDVVHYETAYGRTYVVNHPDHIAQVFQSDNYPRGSLLKMVLGEGLISSEGPYWRNQRRLMHPNFRPQRVATFADLITRTVSVMLQEWQHHADRQQPIDIAVEMLKLSLDIVLKALFSGDARVKNEATMVGDAIATMMKDVGGFVCTEFTSPLSISSSRNQQFQETLRKVDEIVYGMIEERRRRKDQPDDLLALLLSARDEAGAYLDDRKIRDEVVTMLFAGSETTSLMLGWTWYLLSMHPEVEQRLHAQLNEVLGGRQPTIDDLPKLPYVRMVLQESMRLYPPVWSIFRKAHLDDEIGGYDVLAGATVIVSPYTMHRHPDYWEKPEQFYPEHFATEAVEQRLRHVYIPFGGGQHHCLGSHFAMLEGQLVVAAIAQRYRIRPIPDHQIEPLPVVTLRQRCGIMATLDPR
jgi:cytochrome P450